MRSVAAAERAQTVAVFVRRTELVHALLEIPQIAVRTNPLILNLVYSKISTKGA